MFYGAAYLIGMAWLAFRIFFGSESPTMLDLAVAVGALTAFIVMATS